MIDLSAIKPNVVSRDVRGYSFLIYGGPKVGKTTLLSRFPKHLIVAAEKGYSTIPNAMAVPINSWAEFLQVLGQLKSDNKKYEIAKAKGEKYERMFETIGIDVVDILYDYCEKYVLAQNGVQKVSDIPFGQGYALIAKEFDEKLRSIVQMNYGLVLISHAKITKSEDNPDLSYATCTLGNKPKNICTRLVDIYGYATVDQTEDGLIHALHVRQTPEWDAGSRFKYMEETIPLTYKSLVDAIHNAIDREAEDFGDEIVTTDSSINHYTVEEQPSYDELMNSINGLIEEIMNKAINEDNGDKAQLIISSIISKYLGEGAKLSKATPNQIEQLTMIELELKEVE